MSHAFASLYFHCVFATKYRLPTLNEEIRRQLFPYIAAIAERHGFETYTVSGYEEHVHALLSLPPTIAVSRAIQLIKGNSSRWLNVSLDWKRRFAWQSGYSAFSIGHSQIPTTMRYIASQPEKHQKLNFKAELDAFHRKHNVIIKPESPSGDDINLAQRFNAGNA